MKLPLRSGKNAKFLSAVVRHRNSTKDLSKHFQNYENASSVLPRPAVVKGVYKGQYFRIKVPPKQAACEQDVVLKLPNPTGIFPQLFQLPTLGTASEMAGTSVAAKTTAGRGQGKQQQQQQHDAWERFLAFLKLNSSTMIMNVGSLCTLMAFTRTDVLELRTLSVSGSTCFIIYNILQKPIRWLPVGWTSLFLLVNTTRIIQILEERHSQVEMTEEEEKCFDRYFQKFGITPKQFEAITQSAERMVVKKNEPLIKQGQRLDHVYLVVEGSTRASILGRYLTAASSTPVAEPQHHHHDNNSGAWVGEMAFIEQNGSHAHAMYTVVAKEDCVVWRWTHADMERLMARSPDLRGALTRAMTSAIVGKVISFTVSRSSARPTWQTWLDNWNTKRSVSPQHPIAYRTTEPAEDNVEERHGHHDQETSTSRKKNKAGVGRESPA